MSENVKISEYGKTGKGSDQTPPEGRMAPWPGSGRKGAYLNGSLPEHEISVLFRVWKATGHWWPPRSEDELIVTAIEEVMTS